MGAGVQNNANNFYVCLWHGMEKSTCYSNINANGM